MQKPFLTARWRWLAMLNYEIDPAILQPLVPRGTELDFFEHKTYVSVVGFLFLDTRVLGWPIPGHRNFEEVNLRFYVRREAGEELRRGVSFIKELVPRWAIATVAHRAYNEPYAAVRMRHRITGESPTGIQSASYKWRWRGQWQGIQITCDQNAQPLVAGSHEEFIAEHYWGYCPQRDGSTIEYRVEHEPWRVQPARNARLDCDVSKLYGEPFASTIMREPDTAFVAVGSDVVVYKPRFIV